MPIPETQLDTWSHQGSITNSANTGQSVKNAIDSYKGFPDGVNYEVYLQGSYKNDTNVYGESDVDVVVELKSSFQNNLTQEQKDSLGFINSDYGFNDFRNDIDSCLSNYYDSQSIELGNKVIKIPTANNRLDADVLVCSQYRLFYGTLSKDNYYSGIVFTTRNTSQRVMNFPKIHSENATNKHQVTSQWFKPTVRIFKNIRNHLVNHYGFQKSMAPSYFIECLISNIPDNHFHRNYQTTIQNCYIYLTQNSIDSFMCLNGIRNLWGNTSENWNQNDARNFLRLFWHLWSNW